MTKKSSVTYTALSEDFFTIPEVSYRGKTRTYNLFEELTPFMNNSKRIEYNIKARQKGNPIIPDAPLTMNLMHKLSKSKPGEKSGYEINDAKNFLFQNLKIYIVTASNVFYNSVGNDSGIHNIGTKDKYSVKGNFIGKDDWIMNLSKEGIFRKVFGLSAKQINEFSNWMFDRNSYLLRINRKPEQDKEERNVGLNVCSDRFLLDGYCILDFDYPSFRVQKVE